VSPRLHGIPLAVVALAALVLPLGACSRGDAQPEAPETIAVTVQAARLGSLRDTVSVSGNVVPTAVGDFTALADQPAEIVEITKNEGDAVKTGEILVKLEVAAITNEIATRQLELGEATSRLEASKAEETKLESLVSQGLAARNRLETARSARLAAEANVNQIKTRFDAAKALESGTIIRARFPGVVIKRWHAAGDVVAGGPTDPILRVIDPTHLQVAIQVPRAQFDRINQGMPATVQTGAGTEQAVVVMKGAITSDTATTVEIRLNLTTTTPPPLDSLVQVEIVLEEMQNALVIPVGAVQRGDKGPFVWVVSETSQAVKRDVRTGLTSMGMAQVLSGVAAGDQVIVTGIAQLTEGIAVTVTK